MCNSRKGSMSLDCRHTDSDLRCFCGRICVQSNHGCKYNVRRCSREKLRRGRITEEGSRTCCIEMWAVQTSIPNSCACQDKLIDPSSVSHVFKLSPSVGCVMTGSIADARASASRAISEAAEFMYKNGYEMPCDVLAKRLANINQVYTQRVSKLDSQRPVTC